MLIPHNTVIALIDGEHFELYRNSGKEAAVELTSMEVPELETTNYSYGSADHDKVSRFTRGAPKDRLDKLEESAHAVAATEWLNAQVLKHKFDRVIVIADPRSLGEMRKHYHKELERALLCEIAKDLIGRKPPEILEALRGR